MTLSLSSLSKGMAHAFNKQLEPELLWWPSNWSWRALLPATLFKLLCS